MCQRTTQHLSALPTAIRVFTLIGYINSAGWLIDIYGTIHGLAGLLLFWLSNWFFVVDELKHVSIIGTMLLFDPS